MAQEQGQEQALGPQMAVETAQALEQAAQRALAKAKELGLLKVQEQE